MKLELKVEDGTAMGAFVARPDGSGPHPGLVLFQEAFGVNDHIRDVALRLSREGFVVIAPELYHRFAPGFESGYEDTTQAIAHLRRVEDAGLQADIRAARAWLAAQKDVAKDDVGCIGFCMGGRAAYLAAATAPFKAAVSFYGGGIAPGLLGKAAQVSAPVLLIWGGKDRHIPPQQTAQVSDALRRAGKTFVAAEFAAADHGFFCDQRAAYHEPSARQAWALALQFLRRPA